MKLLGICALATLAQATSYCRPMAKGVFSNCGSSRDAFVFDSVALTPEKPKKNATNYIHVTGKLTEPLVQGAYVNVTILHDGTRYDDNFKDLCGLLDQLKTERRCPVPAQDIAFVSSLEITEFFPSGRYQIDIAAFSTNRQIFAFKIDTTL